MPLFGLVQGLQPIVGFNYGARKTGRVREAVRAAVVFATTLATAGFLVLMIFPEPILGLFSKDPLLISEGKRIIRTLVILLPLVGVQIIGASLFQALGKAGPALFLSMSRQVLFLIPLILILPMSSGLPGIWVSFPLADSMSILVTATWVVLEMRKLSRLPLRLESA